MSDAKFHGWAAFGADSIKGNFKEWDYTPKPFDDDDIESEYRIKAAGLGSSHGRGPSRLTRYSRYHILRYLRFRHPHSR